MVRTSMCSVRGSSFWKDFAQDEEGRRGRLRGFIAVLVFYDFPAGSTSEP